MHVILDQCSSKEKAVSNKNPGFRPGPKTKQETWNKLNSRDFTIALLFSKGFLKPL